MFLKRTLVLVVGVLLFIGAFQLRMRLADARLDNSFRQVRLKYGVEGTVLTAAQPSFTMPASTDTSSAPPPATNAPAPSVDASSSDTPAPVPGAAPDTNVIIGPVAPTPDSEAAPVTPGPATPDSSGAPASSTPISPVPDANTNSGPIAPPSSTYVSPREARLMSLLIGAVEPAVTNAAAPTNREPASAATNTVAPEAAAPAAETNSSPVTAPGTNASAGAPPIGLTNAAPMHAVSVAGRAIVLGYHQFTGPGVPSRNIYSMSQDVFATEMKYLHDNGYNVVPLSDVVRFVKHEIGLPPNAVAITIDDGYKSAINYAAPVLKQYGYPWTFFVYPAFITTAESKGAASWNDLTQLQADGVDIECHSMTHPQLTKKIQKFDGSRHLLSSEEYDQFLTSETSGAKAILESHLHKTVNYFAYPYGDYNQVVEAKTIAAGFEAIFTVADNPVHITTDIHSIGRYIITKPVERLFASYLKQGALSLAQVEPAPGSTTSDPEPVITAVLGFTGDPKTLETSIRDYGIVRHDFDPATSTVRIYLPRPLVQPTVLVSIRARDVQSGQTMVANWHFNYEPAAGALPLAHPPIAGAPAAEGEFAPMPKATTNAVAPIPAATNAPASSSKGGK